MELNNFYVCSLWVLLKKGTITKIKNLETILRNKNIFKLVQQYLKMDQDDLIFLVFDLLLNQNLKIQLYSHHNLIAIDMDKNNNSLIIKYYRLS